MRKELWKYRRDLFIASVDERTTAARLRAVQGAKQTKRQTAQVTSQGGRGAELIPLAGGDGPVDRIHAGIERRAQRTRLPLCSSYDILICLRSRQRCVVHEKPGKRANASTASSSGRTSARLCATRVCCGSPTAQCRRTAALSTGRCRTPGTCLYRNMTVFAPCRNTRRSM